MKISYNWLQSFFDKKLPKPEKLAEALTMHSFEVEEIHEVRLQKSPKSDFILGIDILPNRAHDCLCHVGVAKEISAILNLKIKNQKSKLQFKNQKSKNNLKIEIQEADLCRRYIGRIVEGLEVGPSPKWLKERLEAIGQKSINNIVDAANYAMFEVGQPLHVFDLDKVDGNIIIRKAKNGEKIITLDNQEIELDENVLIIADNSDPLAIAGIKGGKKAEVGIETKNIILEAANFEPSNIRRASRRLNLRTESSLRFENEITPELAEIAIDRLTALILETAGGKTGTKIDYYPKKANQYKLGIHPKDVENLLGVHIPEKEIIDIFARLGFGVKKINPLKNILALAKSLRGKSYKYGASVTFDAPDSFDCSSFVSYVFAHSGVRIPRMAIDQYFFGRPIELKEIKPGDVIFSNTKKGKIHYSSREFMNGLKTKEGIDHCGIYLGNGKIIHASRYNKNGVEIEDLKKATQFINIVGIRRMVWQDDDLLIVSIPHERLDVRIKEDLIEEAGRVYGYEKIKPELPSGMLVPPVRNNNYFYSDMAKNILVGMGFSEIYAYSFAEKGDNELQNPIARDKAFLRTNLSDGLALAIKANNPYFEKIKIFEIGKIFPKEGEILALSGAIKGGDFYEVKGVVDILLRKMGISDFYYKENEHKIAEIRVGNTSIGEVGRGVFEINFEELVRLVNEEIEYRPISKYPAALRDIAIFVPSKTKVIEILDVIENTVGELLADTDLFDIFEKDNRKSLAFHLIFQSNKKTLADAEINEIMQKIFTALESNPEWEVRK